MTDEMKSADTFSQRNDADQRATQSNDGVMAITYNRVQQSRGFARDAINALRAYAPTETTKIAEMYMVMGFMEMTLGQDFCNGIPLGETAGGVVTYTAPITDAAVFQQAIARYDSALALVTGTDAQSVYIAKARAQVDLGLFDAAAKTVAGIPTSFVYLITYSQTTQSNEWWQMSTSNKRYTVADTNDVAGDKNNLSFASSNDPRVKVKVNNGKGFDGITTFNEFLNYGREEATPLVAGLDARLIEAEALLQTGDYAGMNAILNTLRATPPKYGNFTITAMAPLVVPATKDAAIDQLFREKAFWQFGRGERLSDLRRLIRQYKRTEDQVYPVGPFHKNGVYGPNLSFPVPDLEKSNPQFNGCLDKNA
jgi:hypothetical protein